MSSLDYGFRVVPFVTATSTGIQTISIPSGPGSNKVPKAVELYVCGATSLDTHTNGARIGIGISDGTNHRCVSAMMEHNQIANVADTGYRISTTAILEIIGTASQSQEAVASFDSFNTGNVKIDWTVAPSAAYQGYAIIWYGSDLQAHVTSGAGSATLNGTVTNSSVGFQSTLLKAFSVGQSAFASGSGNEMMLSIGACDYNLAQGCIVAVAEDRESNTSVGQLFTGGGVSGRLVSSLTSTAGVVAQGPGLEVTTISSNGWTLTTRDTGVALASMILSIKTPCRTSVQADAFDFSATGDLELAHPFWTRGFGLASGRTAAINTVGSGQGNPAVGASDGTSQAAVTLRSSDNVGTSSTQSYATNSSSIVTINSADIDMAAEFDSASSETLRLSISDSAGADRVLLIWAIEDLFSGQAYGSATARASAARVRTATAKSLGSATAKASAARVRTATAKSLGSATARATGTVISEDTPRGTALGSATARASAARVRSATAKSLGSATAKASSTRLRATSGTALGSATARASAARVRTATTKALGSATARASAARVRTATTKALGSATARASATATRASRGTSYGTSRALTASTRITVATANSLGSSRAMGSATVTRSARGTSLGSSLAIATLGVNVVTAAGRGLGSSAARATATVVKVSYGRAHGTSAGRAATTRVRGARGLAAASSASRATTSVTRASRGTATGSSAARAVASAQLSARGRATGASSTRARASALLSARGYAIGSASARANFTVRRASGHATGSSIARAYASTTTSLCASQDTALDERIVPLALSILQRLGRQVTFVTFASRTLNKATGKVTQTSTQLLQRTASPPLQYSDRWGEDTVRVGEAQLIVPKKNLGFEPLRKMDVIIDGGTWTIERVSAVRSGDEIAIYVLDVVGSKAPRASQTTAQGTLDARLPATAKRLIAQYGKKVTFEVASARLKNVGAGEVDDVGIARFCESVVFEPSDENVDAAVTSESHNLVGYLRAQGLLWDPYKGMEATFDAERWTVTALFPIYTGGLIGAWRMEFGR